MVCKQSRQGLSQNVQLGILDRKSRGCGVGPWVLHTCALLGCACAKLPVCASLYARYLCVSTLFVWLVVVGRLCCVERAGVFASRYNVYMYIYGPGQGSLVLSWRGYQRIPCVQDPLRRSRRQSKPDRLMGSTLTSDRKPQSSPHYPPLYLKVSQRGL
ncbi:hypothetical protein DFH11DRAFT_971433 [Phellopilus nigrolimitatus]|nr:hypothetical protein DFH11DRAFT_971433 [Phellopilus nigrolimitatus]